MSKTSSQAPCLYCKSTTNAFTSREHIVPESLGNNELILPIGVVCDVCNNGVLARLDDFLLKSEPISLVRVFNKIPNKLGAMPKANYGNMILKTTPTGIGFEMDKFSPKHFIEGEPLEDGSIPLKFKMKGRKITVKYCKTLARSLYKIGFAVAFLDHGYAFTDDASFDEVREIILGKKDFSGYIIIKSNVPTNTSNMSYRFLNFPDGSKVMMFQLDFFGQEFWFDFEKREIMDVDLLKQHGLSVLKW